MASTTKGRRDDQRTGETGAGAVMAFPHAAGDTMADEGRLSLRPYQAEAVAAIAAGLRDGGRAQLRAECGTGKTFIASKAAAELLAAGSGVVVALVPSLALAAQTITGWQAGCPVGWWPSKARTVTLVFRRLQDPCRVRSQRLAARPARQAQNRPDHGGAGAAAGRSRILLGPRRRSVERLLPGGARLAADLITAQPQAAGRRVTSDTASLRLHRQPVAAIALDYGDMLSTGRMGGKDRYAAGRQAAGQYAGPPGTVGYIDAGLSRLPGRRTAGHWPSLGLRRRPAAQSGVPAVSPGAWRACP
jgi:hypothetical protein